MDIAFPEVAINLMKYIKNVFDPNNILNPGKLFPEN
jgi:glycolate oxidase